MKITKFVHSCLLVEMPEPVSRTVLFDPGGMSEAALSAHELKYLDDIFYTHNHGDHLHLPLLKKLLQQFPEVRITAPSEVVEQLKGEGISASDQPSAGITFFDAPHAKIKPYFPYDPPQEVGIHYLDLLTDPGDSHEFNETKQVLALPVQAPWGSVRRAVELALELKPQHILPIHDWHWSDEARRAAYDIMEQVFADAGITFHKLETAVPIVIDTQY